MTIIYSLVEVTLHTIDDALTTAADWVLALQDMEESLDKNISIKVTIDDIKSFQHNVGIPFVSKLKVNISSHFGFQNEVSAFSILDPKKTP